MVLSGIQLKMEKPHTAAAAKKTEKSGKYRGPQRNFVPTVFYLCPHKALKSYPIVNNNKRVVSGWAEWVFGVG